MQRGFSLVELMITIAVAVILMSMAVPSFSSMIMNNRLSATSEELLKGLQLARSEAMRRGATATVCASDGGTACNGTSWKQGWLVWVDLNGDNTLAANEIQRVYGTLASAQELTSVEGVLTLSYLPSGFLNIPAAAQRSFTFCDNRSGEEGRSLVIRVFGHASTTAMTCS